MPTRAATHNGPFHADDVLAFALIRAFLDPDATVTRTRDKAVLDEAEVVFDVGGRFDPESLRFDHHQAAYTGPLSSAGMVLNWLAEQGKVAPSLAEALRVGFVDYVDDVDNGRVAPRAEVPCFPRIVEVLNAPCDSLEDFDAAYLRAVEMAQNMVEGVATDVARIERAKAAVAAAMKAAEDANSSVLFFDQYYPWKAPYFEMGGETHPTEYAMFPANDGTWRVLAIPPKLGDFGQKRPLPEAWAGLSDEALARVVGVDDAVFCHKNRFIAVFKTREGALTAMASHGLLQPES